ncbi:MAG TPA: extracellular solute-binding protein [Candidatus Eisenbergiella merdipullorum]|uniref:Extracellular solute-binding protein n=1 Tax=Candidatus Eisenbergiella merdipullorum TaxID=2838553 RepID=A0A9D2I803_9FIRM|nr:extracellular solute-binding protein [Candidatus Eisenbergiella merdipullorum]
MKRKIISIMLSLMVTGSLLAGCGQSAGGEQTGESAASAAGSAEETVASAEETSASQETDSAQAEGPQEVITVNIWSANMHDKAVMDEMVAEFNDTIGKERGLEIEYLANSNDYSSALELAFAGGTEPDLMTSTWIPTDMLKGWIVPLDEISGLDELIEKRSPYMQVGTTSYEGHVYALPMAVTTRGLVYNKEMFVEAGLVDENGEATPPKTWDEFVEYARILTDVSNNQFGVIIPMMWSDWFTSDIGEPSLVNSGLHMGYDYVTGQYDYESFRAAMEAFLQIKEDGSYLPGEASIDNDPARARFAEGNIGMKFAYSFDVGVFSDQFPAKCDWGVAPLPVADLDNMYLQPMSINGGFCLTQSGLEKLGEENAAIVVEYFSSDEMLARLYEEGVSLPVDPEILVNTTIENPKTGWTEFAQMINISTVLPSVGPIDLSGKPSVSDMFVNEVWPGTMSVDEFIETANQNYNEAMETYAELHPEKDMSVYIVPDWDAHRDSYEP